MKVTTRGGRFAAAILSLIIAVWSTALCVASAASPHTAHGCCAKSAQTASRIAAPRSCCVENLPNYAAAVPVVAGLFAPSAFLVVPSGNQSPEGGARIGSGEPVAARCSGPSIYVLISTFRI